MLMRKCFLAMLMLMPVILMLLNLNTDYANADADLSPCVVILNMIWQTQCFPSYYNLLQWWTSGMILKQCLKRDTEISLACSKLTYLSRFFFSMWEIWPQTKSPHVVLSLVFISHLSMICRPRFLLALPLNNSASFFICVFFVYPSLRLFLILSRNEQFKNSVFSIRVRYFHE